MDIQQVAATPAVTQTANSSSDDLGQDAFLQLLVTQLKYQDPLNPVDSAQSLLQTAQFTMVEKLNEIAAAVTGQSQFGQLAAVGSIVGKVANFTDSLGNQHSGAVSSARVDADGVVLTVGNREVALDAVQSFGAPTPPTIDATTPDTPANTADDQPVSDVDSADTITGEPTTTPSPISGVHPISDEIADFDTLSGYDIATNSDAVTVPYDGPRRFSVGAVVDEFGILDPDTPFADEFIAAGRRWGIAPELLAGVAKVESAFNLDAVSPDGAVGLMQFMPDTSEWMNVDPLNPASAIDGAARLLRLEYNRFESIELALAAYNAGGGNVEKYGGIPPFEETQNYVPKVLAAAGMS